MTDDVVIRVENLGKEYRIRHQQAERYTALRDVLSQKLFAPFKFLRREASIFQLPSSRASHEDFWALKGVSFEVKRGEVVGIIGRNGAGKSTLLKILSRITEPTTGRVRIRGRVASLLEVGTGFHPELTGRENIFLNGAILGMMKREILSKFDEIVAFAEVEKFLDTPVKHYSSGMYVRLAFAVAAHLEPEILVVDEVLAVGDAEFQKKCLRKLEQVTAGQGRTVIFVSHQLGLLRELCSSGVLLANGCSRRYSQIEPAIQDYLKSLAEHSHSVAVEGDVIKSVEFGTTDQSHGHLFFGERLKVTVGLRDVPSNPLGLNISIRNDSGRLLSLFSTNPHDGFTIPNGIHVRIVFSMEFCSLAPGKYFIDVALTEPAIRIIEELPSVVTFDVLPRPLGGHWPYESRFGDFFPQHSWAIERP